MSCILLPKISDLIIKLIYFFKNRDKSSMRIFILAITLLVLGCGTTDSIALKEKEVGYWGDKSSSGKSLKWNCTNSTTFQDTCKEQGGKNINENWIDAIWEFLKRV